ncbi:MAG: thiamine biosynthesis protein ThiF [Bryobacteraceae bacterium]
MSKFSTAESLHRLVKEAIDSGAASTIGEAQQMFRTFRLGIEINEGEAQSATHQAALLTAVALSRRVFLGGVIVSCPRPTPLAVPLPLARTLGEAVTQLGGTLGEPSIDDPLLTIGGPPKLQYRRFNVRTVYSGWCGGVVPANSDFTFPSRDTVPLAPMLAAALAVNEAFSFVRTGSSAAGRQPVGLSLWNPSPRSDWMVDSEREPILAYLPASLWVVGLGHLGQAFLWGLGLLPYPSSAQLELVLQDIDIITPSSESTSVLSEASLIGRRKTRAMSAWAEQRGFTTKIVERCFDPHFIRRSDEPSVAFCGVDNALARQALDQVGFDFIVEAGLGRGYQDFRAMRLHTLPGPLAASSIWRNGDRSEGTESRPGYQKLLADGDLDQCGVTLLAGKAVGAPFVGSIAACLALSEILRLLHGGRIHQLIDLDLKGMEHRNVVLHPADFSAINPGFVATGSAP